MEDGNKSVQNKKPRVIDSFWAFLVATALFGPFALPLLWRNPRYQTRTKIIGSAAVLVFTYVLLKFTNDFLQRLLSQLTEFQ